jgi:hypothetical protein
MKVVKVTPLLIVERIESVLPFWEGLGWQRIADVPHGDALGFVLLQDGDQALMLQSKASVAADLGTEPPGSALYLDVDSVDGALAAATGAQVFIAERFTPYGTREAWVRDPSGQLVGFAEPHAGAAGKAPA